MDVKTAIWERRSFRKFKNKKIDPSIINKILEAGLQCPSSCNQQMTYFIAVDDEKKKELYHKAGSKLLKRFPLIMFVITDKRFGNTQYANIQSAAAAVQNMFLYAYSLGIGSCWMASFGDKKIVKKILHISKDYHVLGAIGFGYPDEKILPPKKRRVEEVLFWNQFKQPALSKNPQGWSEQEIWGLASRSIFAKSPDIGYFHLFGKQFENECKKLSKFLGKEVLCVFEPSNLYVFQLALMRKDVQFTCLVKEKYVVEWFEERAEHLKLENITFRVDPAMSKTFKNKKEHGKYDTLLYTDIFNRLDLRRNKELLQKVRPFLKNKGRLLLLFLNTYSLLGKLFHKGVARRYGPEISYAFNKVQRVVNKAGFSVRVRTGFNLIPSPRIFFKAGVPGKYTVFNSFFRFWSRFSLLEGYATKTPLRSLCTSQLLVCRKRK
jgi:nitroreductase